MYYLLSPPQTTTHKNAKKCCRTRRLRNQTDGGRRRRKSYIWVSNGTESQRVSSNSFRMHPSRNHFSKLKCPRMPPRLREEESNYVYSARCKQSRGGGLLSRTAGGRGGVERGPRGNSNLFWRGEGSRGERKEEAAAHACDIPLLPLVHAWEMKWRSHWFWWKRKRENVGGWLRGGIPLLHAAIGGEGFHSFFSPYAPSSSFGLMQSFLEWTFLEYK